MPLILLRHLRPLVEEGVCYGATDLAPAPGQEAALAGILGALPPLEAIVTSPRRRCRELAEAIGAARGRAPVVDPRLAEMDFGAWEGLRWDAVPRAELDAWAADFLHARPHGGESVAMLRARVLAALADHRPDSGTRLLVTHAGVIKAATAHGDDWPAAVPFGESVAIC
jgi:alpha-ribazole phosphatase